MQDPRYGRHNDYTKKIEKSIPFNMKSFWSHVKSLRKNSTFPPSMFFGDLQAADAPGNGLLDCPRLLGDVSFTASPEGQCSGAIQHSLDLYGQLAGNVVNTLNVAK